MKVRALLLERDLSLRVGERELAEPAPGELLVQVDWAGVCGSDLHVLRTGDWVTDWPATLGHEVTGRVAASPGGELAPGTRVVVDSRVPCEGCAGCAGGDGPGSAGGPHLCENLAWFGEACPGGFASHVLVPARRVAACPADLEAAIAVLAEPLAVAMHAVSRACPASPERVTIAGYGPIGALVHLEITRRWPETAVTVAEPVPARRQLAAALGAGLAGAIAGTGRPRLVVDAAGYPGSLRDSIAGCARGGTVLVVALGHQPEPLLPADLAERELTLAGSNGFAGELSQAVAALAADPDRYRPLVTEAIVLDEAPRRLPGLLTAPAAGKVVIRPSID
ncbi:MAG: alcohol dehydrogenase catalytic domain-containing protein [Streptosporangiaceae bacterium]|nr:alcohol dehydrogenase catalytic domain-containing protein [Streptosporangiaceae bacterium]